MKKSPAIRLTAVLLGAITIILTACSGQDTTDASSGDTAGSSVPSTAATNEKVFEFTPPAGWIENSSRDFSMYICLQEPDTSITVQQMPLDPTISSHTKESYQDLLQKNDPSAYVQDFRSVSVNYMQGIRIDYTRMSQETTLTNIQYFISSDTYSYILALTTSNYQLIRSFDSCVASFREV